MAIEDAVAALTTANTALVTAVGTQQLAVTAAVAGMTAVTSRVNTGLNYVDNTHDADKPVSLAAAAALGLKQATLVSGTNISTVNGQSLLGGQPLVIARSATSLASLAYASRASLRATTSQADDSCVIEGLGLFMFVTTQFEPDDDETCFTNAGGQWLLSAPAWDLIDAWGLMEKSVIDDFIEDAPAKFAPHL